MATQTDLDNAISTVNALIVEASEALQAIKNANFSGPGDIADHEADKSAHPNLIATHKEDPNAHNFFNKLGIGNSVVGSNKKTEISESNNCSWVGLTGLVNGSATPYPAVVFTVGNAEGTDVALPVGAVFGGFQWRGYANGENKAYGNIRSYLTDEFNSLISFAVTYNGIYQNSLWVQGASTAPAIDNQMDLGSVNHRFKDLFLVNQPTVSSDKRNKENVEVIDAGTAEAFINALEPVSFTLKAADSVVTEADEEGNVQSTRGVEGKRKHMGFLAQDVKTALDESGVGDCGLWCLSDKDDPESMQGLRYDELIAPMLAVIKSQQARIKQIEEKLKDRENAV